VPHSPLWQEVAQVPRHPLDLGPNPRFLPPLKFVEYNISQIQGCWIPLKMIPFAKDAPFPTIVDIPSLEHRSS